MSIISSTAHSSDDASFYPFEIGQSLRFDGSSRLTKTQSSSNSNWTMSLWVKLSNLSSSQYLFATGTASPNHWTSIFWANNSFYYILNDGTGSNGVVPTVLFRDPSGWYHIVVNRGSTANMWINGVLIGTESNPDVGNVNTTDPMEIGSIANTAIFNGYMAEINFIDGQALNPYYFGEFKNGSVWIPKQFDGTASDTTYNVSGASNAYGTNGFRLSFDSSDFNTSGSAVTDPHGSSTNVPDGYVADASGSGNHWNVN